MLTIEGNRLDGCLFGEASSQDYRMEFGDNKLPRQVDLRPHCTEVENQGQIGSCTANACVGALEYFYRKRDGHAPELSRMFVYYNTRRLKGTIQQDTGAMINEAMAAVMAFGACEAQYWPYDPNLFIQEPPQQAYKNGRTHEAIQYARVPGAQGALPALANGYPVVFGTFLPQRCYQQAAVNGRVPTTSPQERTGQPGGGHCMLIVGYDLDAKIFIVRNSWGTQWANGGYCEIPFEEMAYWSPPETFWIMLELEPRGNFSVIRPMHDSPQEQQNKIAALGARKLNASAASLRDSIGSELRGELDMLSTEIRSRTDQLRISLAGGPPASSSASADGQSFGTFCNTCSGAGSCYSCGGSGRAIATGLSADPNCIKCFGSGRCNSCGGRGET